MPLAERDNFIIKFRISEHNPAHVIALNGVTLAYAQAFWDRLSIGFEMVSRRPV
jgi:hypothetical protein